MSIGFTLPFSRATGSLGYLESTRDVYSATEQNLRSLVVTNWGERVMHLRFGCNLIEFVFEQRTSGLKSRIVDRVTSQVATWLPYVSLDDVSVFFSEDDGSVPEEGIWVRITYRLDGKQDSQSIFNHLVTP
jgi:phage baseplate assembly protein W